MGEECHCGGECLAAIVVKQEGRIVALEQENSARRIAFESMMDMLRIQIKTVEDLRRWREAVFTRIEFKKRELAVLGSKLT